MPSNQIAVAPKHRTAKGAQRVQALVEAAAELFLDRGFEAVAVDDLIARVGGSRTNVYSHFGGKDGLFKAAMLHLCAEIAKPIEQLRLEGDKAEEVLGKFGRALVKTALSPRTLALHRLLTTEGQRFSDVAQAMWEVSYHKVIQMLAVWIMQRQVQPDHGISSPLPSEVLAQQFVSMVTSDVKLRAIVGLVCLPLPAEQVDALVENAVQTFLHGATANRVARSRTAP